MNCDFTYGAIHKLCRLKIGNFWPPPLSSFLLSKVYICSKSSLGLTLSPPAPCRNDIIYERTQIKWKALPFYVSCDSHGFMPGGRFLNQVGTNFFIFRAKSATPRPPLLFGTIWWMYWKWAQISPPVSTGPDCEFELLKSFPSSLQTNSGGKFNLFCFSGARGLLYIL